MYYEVQQGAVESQVNTVHSELRKTLTLAFRVRKILSKKTRFKTLTEDGKYWIGYQMATKLVT